jgi:EAL domain-containing protein (putative c-di-GMP-specific phosphodiesterase class I)/GGDEF domain-containing protein/predicted transcriptional regulator
MTSMSTSSLHFHLRQQNYIDIRKRHNHILVAATAPGENAATAEHDHLRQIIDERRLTPLFQPIVDLAQGLVHGYEGLIRGPADSPLHSPLKLFSVAESQGLRTDVEYLARQVTIEHFWQLALPGRLFLNVSPECLLQPMSRSGRTLDYIREIGIDPARIVIELTENQPTFDFELMREAVRHYRSMGFAIAIDDLGQGFSGLRLWSELRPEFVKIDRHFVGGVDSDPVKRQFLRSIQDIAKSVGCTVIAEGVETPGEMAAVASAGIALGQGYAFARPCATPTATLADEVRAELREVIEAARRQSRPRAAVKAAGRKLPTALDMIRDVPVVEHSASTASVFALFEAHPDLQSLPVLRRERPVGLISRANLIDRYARPYRRELYGKKPCAVVMDPQPLLVEAATSLQDLSFLLAEADQRHLAEGFIVVEAGSYRGYGSGHDVMREITRRQIEAARHTNPLTGLPGNLPLDDCIDAWLAVGHNFVACYCDLDHFKPYNDVYGYSRGDDLIRALADTLHARCDSHDDFIGHIGGDDFMILFSSGDWELRCQGILDDFGAQAKRFFGTADLETGGYWAENRQGERVFMPLVSLSLGAVHVESGHFSAYHQVAAAAAVAKKEAKKIAGNSLFVERRHEAANAAVPPAPTLCGVEAP